EAGIAERQVPHVADGAVQGAWTGVERRARLNNRRLGDVDAVCAGALTAGPREDGRVLGFIPQIGLENPESFERGEVLREQPSFVVRVVPRRDRTPEVGKALADPSPEIAVRRARSDRVVARRRLEGRPGCSPRPIQVHAPRANDSRRGSLPSITAPAT